MIAHFLIYFNKFKHISILNSLTTIHAIALWLNYGIRTAEKKEQQKSKESAEESKRSLMEIGESFNTVLTLVPTCTMCVFFGLGAFYSPRYFIETASALHTRPQEGLLYGMVAVIIAAVMYPGILARYVHVCEGCVG